MNQNKMKKTLSTPEVEVLRIGKGMWTDGAGISEGGFEGWGDDAPVRQQTDFFGNTILVPIDDDWE